MEVVGSALTNKYSEGLPGSRYYGGNEVIDKIERICQARALDAYGLNPEEWGVNVQPYSGSPANFAVFTGLLRPHDRIMGLDLASGGHLTHGYYTQTKSGERKAISASSTYFESLPYTVSPDTGLIDFDSLTKMAGVFKPALLICGGSAYPRDWDYSKFREIADANKSLLMCDMAHISGLVATGEAANPFDFCDIVTTTTHKTMRGPRSGIIFYRKDERGFERKINMAVFPGLQGGPHEHQIAAVATQLLQLKTPEFKKYIQQVKANCSHLCDELAKRGYSMATGGSENHLLLWDLRPLKLTGSKLEALCDAACITLNKNSVPGDRSAMSPGGVRIGTPAMTTRGLGLEDFTKVADFLDQAVKMSLELQETTGKMLAPFKAALKDHEGVKTLREAVKEFSRAFEMPGL